MSKRTTKVTVSISDKLEADLIRYGKAICKKLATTARDKISDHFTYIINRFYWEYTPGDYGKGPFYVRHASRGMSPGLPLVFSKYYRNPHGTIYSGGIIINEQRMYDDYHGEKEDVLGSFLSGFHGPYFVGIHKGSFPLAEIMEYRDTMIDHIDTIMPDAISYAQKQAYTILRF